MYKDITPNRKVALFLAKRAIPELVYEAVNLEGINFTLPEVQTLLQNITIGGKSLSDSIITKNQADAWTHLINSIQDNNFSLSKEFVCKLHGIAGREEALIWGEFRTGMVSIAGEESPRPHPSELNELWESLVQHTEQIDDPFERACYVFGEMAKNQFFFDVNKRMGRFMMNGILLNEGYPAINLRAQDQLAFNETMMSFYRDSDHTRLTKFFEDYCRCDKTIEAMRSTTEAINAASKTIKPKNPSPNSDHSLD